VSLSQSQLTKLGERLKAALTAQDLRLLDDYRRSFNVACDGVVLVIRSELGLQLTVRSAKSTQAIIEKLRRQSIRLGQIQDIAGCRIVVSSVTEQDAIVVHLKRLFPGCAVDDRRTRPSHGYTAVHVIVKAFDRCVEIQVRTELQHLWASVSEKLADTLGNGLKYGNGAAEPLAWLSETAKLIIDLEAVALAVDMAELRLTEGDAELAQTLGQIREKLQTQAQGLIVALRQSLSDLTNAGDGT